MSWRCPYCNQIATLLTSNMSSEDHTFDKKNKDGTLTLKTQVIVCPNSECREYTIHGWLYGYETTTRGVTTRNFLPNLKWSLKPQSAAKPLPDYVPKAIQDDYKEACLIQNLSPKASATLSRRCLQGMIRNFHGIVERNLNEEIKKLEAKVDAPTWNAIDAVRKIGNIGAHMEADINIIVDVDPSEASVLIGLIETLIDEWYVHRYERAQRMDRIIAIAEGKKADQDAGKIVSKEATPDQENGE